MVDIQPARGARPPDASLSVMKALWCCAAWRAPPRPNAQVRIDVKMTEVVFTGFSCLFFYLLQCGLLEGQPDWRLVAILVIGPLDHHDECDTPLHVDPGLSTVGSAVAEGSGREHFSYTLRLADDADSQPPAVAGSKAGDQIASLDG